MADFNKDILACGNTNDPAVMIGNIDATDRILMTGARNWHI